MNNKKSYREQLFDLGIPLTHTGRCKCPQCSAMRKKKNDKCLQISFDTDAVKYHCFNCGWSGVISYNNDRKDNFKPIKVYVRPQELKEVNEKQPLYDYFKGRGISQSTVDEFGLSLENGKIIFPYYRNGELVNVKYRGLKEKVFQQGKDCMPSMFGIDTVPTNAKTICITEGEIDTMSLYECGYYAVSVNQGGNDSSLDCITNCWEFMDSFETIIIAGDNDQVGKVLVNNLKERFKHKFVKIVDWSKYCDGAIKDANDCLKYEDGKSIIKDAILTAKEVDISGITTYLEHKEELMDWFDGKKDQNFSTGWNNIDEIFKIQKQRLMIVSGISGKGKSLFVDNLLFNLTKQFKWKHLLASFETTYRGHMVSLSQMLTKKSCWEKTGNRMSREDFEKSINTLSPYFLRFDIEKQWTITEILQTAEASLVKYHYDTLIIDPYNRLAPEKYDREDKYIESILSSLLTFAKKHNVFIVFIAHPTKIPEEDKIPTLQNISGGVAWHSIADIGVIVHRERDKQTRKLLTKSIIRVEKVKDETIGNTAGGEAFLTFSYDSYSLIDLK
jgi:twinkle protein